MTHDVFTNKFSQDVFLQKYSMDGKESWRETVDRVVDNVCGELMSYSRQQELKQKMYDRKFIPAGRYLYSAGRPFHQVNNCFLFRAEDSREGWADISHKAVSSLMTGGGIGVDYTAIRPNGYSISRTGGKATGPLSVMHIVNESGRYVMQGGQRRSAIWAGLSWFHDDIPDFLRLKDHAPELREAKDRDFNFPLTMELTNISTIYDDIFFGLMDGRISSGEAARILSERVQWVDHYQMLARDLRYEARQVWLQNCIQAFSSAEPGFSFNVQNWRDSLRNACTEVTSEDDSDKCNLGTVWMQAHDSVVDFSETVDLATEFLLCGSEYSHLPTEKIAEVGARNNRIGLGLGGMHEWLMQRGMPYCVTPEMSRWLRAYAEVSDHSAEVSARALGVSVPVARRAIAPTGTIGIIAETTTGIEPLFCKAYLRRYYKDGTWYQQYVVDAAVKRLLDQGIPIENIQDSYELSFEERVRFQADVQDYVDMAISSTCNMPEYRARDWPERQKQMLEEQGAYEFLDIEYLWDAYETHPNTQDNVEKKADILLRYAPRLRGFTCYPDGSRGGQPLTKVDLREALKHEGTVFEAQEHECVGGVCGI